MTKRRTAHQIEQRLNEADRDVAKGLTVADLSRKLGLAENTYFYSVPRYPSLILGGARRLCRRQSSALASSFRRRRRVIWRRRRSGWSTGNRWFSGAPITKVSSQAEMRRSLFVCTRQTNPSTTIGPFSPTRTSMRCLRMGWRAIMPADPTREVGSFRRVQACLMERYRGLVT
jgi:hypothetical protein